MARGLCVNSKVLHEEKVRLSNTGQILRGAFVGMVLARHSLKSILNTRLCVTRHTEEQSMAVKALLPYNGTQPLEPPNETGQSPRVTTRGPAHTRTVSVCSSCRTPALRKRTVQPGLEMGLASRQGPRLSPRCGTCTLPCFPQLAKWSRTRGEDRSGVTPAPMISLLRELPSPFLFLLYFFSFSRKVFLGW